MILRKKAYEIFLMQLSTLLKAGVPILTALHALGKASPPRLRTKILRVATAIENGEAFAKAATRELAAIGPVSLGLIRAGEANGTLDAMLLRAAELLERSRKNREQILQALAYPSVVFVLALGVCAFMVYSVFPVVMSFIESTRRQVEMPLPTRMVIQINDFFVQYGLYVVLAPIVAVVLVTLLRREEKTGAGVDGVFLRIPLVGKALLHHANSMWCMILGSMLQSGLDMLTALDLVQNATGNWYYTGKFRDMRRLLEEGQSFSKGMEKTRLHDLCPMAFTMVSVSEQGGGLDLSLLRAGAYAEDELSRRVTLLGKLVEPAIFLFVGSFVGLVYFGFFLAMLAATRAGL
jgi:type II secretory pathway component PulF